MNRFSKAATTLLIVTLTLAGGLGLSLARRHHSAPNAASTAAPSKALLQAATTPLRPLAFEPNRGQTDPQVKFLSRGKGYTLFLTRNGAVLSLRKAAPANIHGNLSAGDPIAQAKKSQATPPAVLRLQLLGANASSQITGEEQLPGINNYFLGNDPSKWRTNISTFGKVGYRNVYPNVDLIYYGNQGQLEHDFVVKPGANPKSIRLGFEGADKLTLGPQGDLLVEAGGAEVSFHAPVIYQQFGAEKRSIKGHYVIKNQKQVGFEVAAYDVNTPLVIDPVLVYSTYVGGSGDDFGTGIAVDGSGNAYIVGQTPSANFPTVTPAQATNAGGIDDVFVTKLNTTGTALVYSTFLGGSGDDEGLGIVVDSAGNAYISGDTDSTNFPVTATAFQKTQGGNGDAFVAKLSATGSTLVYSSYLGGNAFDIAFDLAIDSAGNAYICGQTYSDNFPLAGTPAQSSYGGFSEAFITKMNPTGTALVYSTYWGGSNSDEQARAIVVDSAGNAYVTGQTTSTNFPTTPSPIQGTYGGGTFDAIAMKLNPTGSAMLYSTYMGGNALDQGRGIAVDSAGNAYITGQTASQNFPTAGNAFQKTYGGGIADGFIFKVNPTGSALVFSGYFGGTGEDQGDHGMAIDASGNIYIAGFTKSTDFPVVNPIQSTNAGGAYDAIVMKLPSDGSSLIYSTYLGGNFDDSGRAIAVDPSGNAYVVSYTNSTTFPTTANAFQRTNAGGYDAAVTKIADSAAVVGLSATSLTYVSQVVGTTSAPQVVTLTNSGNLTLNITGITITGTNITDFAQTNTCGASVLAGANCTISVTFSPTAGGTRTASVSIADNATGSPQLITLTGTGQSAGPVATLSTTSLAFGNQQVNTTSAALNILLTNTGAGTMTITSLTFTGTNTADFAQTNTCGASLVGNASCTISVTFKPTALGARTGTLNLTDNAPGSPQGVTLTGTGLTTASAIASLSPTGLTFAAQYVNTTSAAKTVTLTNTGNQTLGLTSVVTSGDYTQTNNCGLVVVAAASCTFNITFKPTAAGTRTGTIVLTDNAADSPQTINLSGIGAAKPTGLFNHVFIVMESNQPYTNIVGFANMPYLNGLIGSYGLATNYYADAHPGLPNYFMLTTGQQVSTDSNLPITNVDNIVRELAPVGKTWKVYAEDLPSVGYLGASVNNYVKSHNPFVYLSDVQGSLVQQQNVVPFSQFATDLANNTLPDYVFIVPNDVNNADSGSRDAADAWLLTNINPLIQSALFQNNSLLIITFDNAPADNTNGGGKVATVLVGPTVKTGYQSTTLYQHESVLRLMARGVGLTTLPGAAATAPDMFEFFTSTTPLVSLSTPVISFGNQLLNTTSAGQSVTLTNTGDATLAITSIASSAGFVQTNNCGASVLALGNCTINVTFTPTVAGPLNGTFTITDNATGSPQIVTLNGNGLGPVPTLTSAAPNTAKLGQSVTVTLAGTNFANSATCDFGAGITVSSCTFDSATLITANVSVAANAVPGNRNIAVTNVDTQKATLANGFTVSQGTGVMALVNKVSAGNSTGSGVASLAAPAANHTAGNLLVVICRNGTNNVTQSSVTDTAGDAFVSLTGVRDTSVGWIQMWYAKNIKGNAANIVTCNFSAAAAYDTISVLQYSGADLNAPLDGQATGFGASNATSGTTAALNPSKIGGMVVVGASVDNLGMIFTAGTGFTLEDAAIAAFSGDEDKSIAALGAVTPAMSWNKSQRWVMAAGSFAPGAGASGPAVFLSPTSLTFASQAVGSTSGPQVVTLSNTGTSALSIASIVTSSDFAQTNTCGASLIAGGNCPINVTFKPTAAGARAGTLIINDNAGSGSQTVVLSGTATAASVGLSPITLTFASQQVGTSSGSQPVTLTNASGSPLTITSITPSTGYGQTNNCVSPIAVNGTCTINVTFTPTVSGPQNGTLAIIDSAPGSPHSVTLNGTGTAPAVTFLPTSLTFASQPTGTTSGAQSFTMTNTGTAPLTFTTIAASGDYAQNNNCVSPIAVNGTCTINVTFSPTAVGTRTGAVSVTDNAPASPQQVTLSGTGSAPAPVVSLVPGSLTFPSQALNTTSLSQTSKLTNTGNANLTYTTIVASGDYAQTNDCVSPIAANAFCTLTVTFTPTAAGTRTGAVTITDNAAGSPHAVNLSGTGLGPAPTLTSATPNAGAQNQTLSVVLGGTNFANSATCNFGTAITVNSCTFNTALQITANITITAAATLGARNVVVTNPDTQIATFTNGFTVNAGAAAITLVNQASAANSTGSTVTSLAAPAANHTAGNLLVVICRNGTNFSAQNAPTDTAGNTFVGLTGVSDTSVGVIQMWYAKNITGNAANVVTCNFPVADAWDTISVLQYAGADQTNPLDAQSTSFGPSATTSGTAPALTPTRVGGMVVVAASADNLGMTFTAGSGFTIRDAAIGAFSGDEDRSVTALGAITPAMSWNQSQRWVMVAAAFK